MSKQLRIVYRNNFPLPYMVERFDAVSDQEGVELEAWLSDRVEPDRSWDVEESTWCFK